MTMTHPLAGLMDDRGMLPAGTFCIGCGKTLNADGNHPAELYAGTYNGLCYGCTGRGAFVEKTADLDGCRMVSWPPRLPSYRRDREQMYAYEGCESCQGLGRVLVRGTAEQCRPCLDRYVSHPLRQWNERRWHVLWDTGNRAWMKVWSKAAGVPVRVKIDGAKANAIREAHWAEVGDEGMAALKAPVRAKATRLRELHKAKAERLGLNAWSIPAEQAARYEAMIQRAHQEALARQAS